MIDAQNRVHPDDNELAAFIQDMLDGPTRAQVESHLAGCQACRSILATYSRAISDMDQVFQPETKKREKRSPILGISFSLPPAWALPLAASLILAIAATALVLSMKEPTSPSQIASAPPSSPTVVDQPPPTSAPAEEVEVPKTPPPPPEPIEPEAEPSREPGVPEPDPTLLARRGGRKIIGHKTFRFRNGVWVDTRYEAAQELPLIEVKKAGPVYHELLGQNPALARYADVGQTVIVVFEGKAYKFTP